MHVREEGIGRKNEGEEEGGGSGKNEEDRKVKNKQTENWEKRQLALLTGERRNCRKERKNKNRGKRKIRDCIRKI